MIADTSFLIDLLRKKPEAVEKAREIEENGTAYALSSPTVYELFLGVARSGAENKEEVLDIIESQNVHPLNLESGLEAGRIQRELIEKGERIGHMDALIAGVAARNGGKLLTGNAGEFSRVEKLEVESY